MATDRRVTPLDLAQQVSLLLIPELKKIAAASEAQDAATKSNMEGEEAEEEEQEQDSGGATPAPLSRGSFRRRSSLVAGSVRDLFGPPKEEARPAPPSADKSCVELALLVLLESAGIEHGVELTPDLLRQILISMGEEHWRDEILEQMIEAARGGQGNNNGAGAAVVLDTESFLRALTADIRLYDERAELNATTHFTDVNATIAPPSAVNSSPSSDPSAAPALKRAFFTASSIDYTADTYASLTWAVLVWFLLFGFFFLYMFDGLGRRMFPLSCDNENNFGCKVANAVVLWLEIMIKICLVGFVYIALSSLGNSVYLLTSDDDTVLSKLKSSAAIVVSLLTVFASTFLSYLVQVDAVLFDTTVVPPPTPFPTYAPGAGDDLFGVVFDDATFATTSPSSSFAFLPPTPAPSSSFRFLQATTAAPSPASASAGGGNRRPVDTLLAVTFIMGAICMGIQLMQIVRVVLPRKVVAPRFVRLFHSSAIHREHQVKEAASHKTRQMLRNALSCHSLPPSLANDQQLASSLKYDAVNTGRLLALNMDGRISHALFQFQQKLLERETVGGVLYTIKGFLGGDSPLATREGIWLFPRLLWCHLGQWFIIVALIVLLVQLPILFSEDLGLEGITVQQFQAVIVGGGSVAVVACASTVTRYVPSAVTTVLRFRSGVHASLRDNRSFHVYRFAQDTSTALFGSSVWGLLFTGIIIWFIVFAIAFGFVWDTTQSLFYQFLAQIIGIIVTIAIKIVLMQLLRRTWYGGFYRKHIAGANVFMVLIECWNLALSSGYILARSIKFIFLSILYIARVDTPFLAEGVGYLVAQIPLDAYAISFRKDLLIHEAHRHPYMERWAMLYLLKLRHGPAFGTPAGAAWRILLTLALMPWLRNYRVYPTLGSAAGWSTRHSSAMGHGGGGGSYEELHSRNQQLELEIERLKRRVIELENEGATIINL